MINGGDAPHARQHPRGKDHRRNQPRAQREPRTAGAEEELTITLDLARAATLGIQIPEVAAVAARATDVSGGVVEAGRREYVLRFAGRYSPDAMGNLILEVTS